ncbi:MAG TPA: hypothetical protein VGF06_09920, partial [Terriglobales bacterium]
MLGGKRDQVVALIDFPADFVLDGRGVKIASSAEFVDEYDRFFTGYVIDAVRRQAPEELLAGWDGVSLSNGA